MSKEKIIMIALLLILIITLVLNVNLFLKIQANTNLLNEKQEKIKKVENIDKEFYQEMSFYDVTNNTTYYKAVSCVESYFWAMNDLWSNVEIPEGGQEEITSNNNTNSYKVNRVLGILGEKYISRNKINANNIYNKVSQIRSEKTVCNNILAYNLENNVTIYFVKGINFIDENNKSDFALIVVIDNNKNCYSVYPEDYLKTKGLDKIKEEDKINQEVIEELTKIESNQYNKTQNAIYSDEDIIDNYYDLYTTYLEQDINTAYDLLDSEYKNRKFTSIDEFKAFLTKKYNNNFTSPKAYQVEYSGGYKQYIVTDISNNYYIFKETKPMKFSVILDNYTIESKEFIEKYEAGDTQVKTALNIQRIVDALNDGDYRFVYGKLADEFKNNYFSSYESFASYARNKFGEKITVEYVKFIETSHYCTYDIIFKMKDNQIKNTIIMQLQEGTNFVFSFNVDK